MKDKVEKSLDLSLYISYLKELFNQDLNTSDSDGNGGPNNSSTTTVNGVNENENSSDSSALSFSLSDENDDDDSEVNVQIRNPAELLKPVSDHLLKELLQYHERWKKSTIPLGSPEDVRNLLYTNATNKPLNNSSNKVVSSNNRKNKISSSAGTTTAIIPSKKKKLNQNSTEKDGTSISVSEKGVQNKGKHNNNNHLSIRPRKQNLKNLRLEEKTIAKLSTLPTILPMPPSSSASSTNNGNSNTSKAVLPKIITSISNNNESETSMLPNVSTISSSEIISNCDAPLLLPPVKNEPTAVSIKEEPDEETEGKKKLETSTLINKKNGNGKNSDSNIENQNDSNDDDNSLSDFVTMTNTISAPSISSLLLNKNKPATFPPSVPFESPVEVKKTSAKEIKKKQPVQSIGKDASPQKQTKLIEIMNLKRRKIFILIAKKEIGKTQRTRANCVKEMIVARRKIAQACSRHLRQKAIQSQKTTKETNWRAKRLTREMQAYWKQSDRLEREVRRRKEKEAEEQRKLDLEMLEVRRQQRKLNFLITQTELYAHFMSKKLGHVSSNSIGEKDENLILCQLDDNETNSRKSKADDFNCDSMKEKAKANVANALKIQAQQMKEFMIELKGDLKQESDGQFKQPKMFEGVLKHYQLKGMNWLINLYDQGINGILADDMGLGKTIQSIAFLAHVAERYKLWGPILIIAPASTLHNWQQEFRRFVPPFKIVPYWGNPQERKILRQFWQQSNLHTQEASFHVVVTSYQIVVADLKYFNRIKWLYLILDEAQSIKNTASARWKMLLGFNCRNRLLLTGTPIQNTMGELWALLHFIMPTLFDSHEEFNEWFSRDIESHAENKSLIDEKHLSRLHLILKPFMLRRIKKDVENELSDKIEILHYCPLTTRQKKLYSMLKKKIKIEDLLKSAGPSNSQLVQNTTTNLMNLVMQFRKVCNHPELFERREVKSPFNLPKLTNSYPRLLFREGILHLSLPSKVHLLENMFSVFTPENLSIKGNAQKQYAHFSSFLYFIGLTPADVFQSVYGGMLGKLIILLKLQKILRQVYEKSLLREQHENDDKPLENVSLLFDRTDLLINLNEPLSYVRLRNLDCDDLIFTSYTEPFYTFSQHTYHRMPESIDHRQLRSKLLLQSQESISNVEQKISLIDELPHLPRPTEIRRMLPTYLPSFLYQQICPKAISPLREIHFHDRSAAWWIKSLYEMLPGGEETNLINYGKTVNKEILHFSHKNEGGLNSLKSKSGWSQIIIPDKEKLVTDSGKLGVLNSLLKSLKANGHRVLIYSQMTRMIDLLEEYMLHRKYSYIRLDGSSKISERRDMVADFQTRSDIFVFLLSTRAGGLGINLTAADTVIFYDSDWNPTVDQQAMDRAHRLGQTKQVTVYRLICKGTIEERILQRAREKNEIQKMVISGGAFRDSLKPKEVVSLLLDDEDLERKYRQKQAERNISDDNTNSSKSLEDNKVITLKRMSNSTPIKNSLGENGNSKKVKIDSSELSTLQSVQTSDKEDPVKERNDKLFNNVDEKKNVMEWSAFEDEDNFTLISKRPRLGRGTGKRGRPPSRIRSYTRDYCLNLESGEKRGRGPGRPRLKPIGPLNQGMRGRRPGRPPLTRKADPSLILPPNSMNSSINSTSGSPNVNSSAILTPSTTSQKVFGFYSSPDLDIA